MGRNPKPPETRRRRNKVSTRANLPDPALTRGNRVPPMPKRKRGQGAWNSQAKAWWRDVWTSPMSTQHVFSDRHAVEMLAMLVHDFWEATDAKTRISLATTIGRESAKFGLTPLDRNRLQWTINRGEGAADEAAKRRRQQATPAETGKDPREVLKIS